MRISGNTILITGGGSGIGAALARRLHDRGNRIVIAGRRQDALDRAAEGRPGIATMTLDVADPASVADVARRVVAEHPALNILFNNAGIMRFEDVTAARDLADAEETIAINLLGPIRMTDALIGHLADTPHSAVVNFTSGLGFVPMTAAPTYSATKAAIHSYTVSLRAALGDRVEMIELPPPAVRTGLTPGQETRPGYMPLDDFADGVMALLEAQPTPPEVLVEAVRFLRFAEREGRFDDTLRELNERTAKARAAQG